MKDKTATVCIIVVACISSGLTFTAEPLIGKLLLPYFGGVTWVWSICLVYFQLILLLAYLYAHLSWKYLGSKQWMLHTALLLLGLITLPFTLPTDITSGASHGPTELILSLLRTSAPSLFVIMSTSPLLQAWFASTNHPRAHNPYFLYAASNAGSFGGLMAYPLAIEPTLRVSTQTRAWMLCFVFIAVAIGLIGFWSYRRRLLDNPTTAPSAAQVVDGDTSARNMFIWLVIAAIPSSLLVGVTTHLTTDIAPVPLLWIIPLALYLGTYTLAFAKPDWRATTLLPIACLVLIFARQFDYFMSRSQLMYRLGLELLLFTLIAYWCHSYLARHRPHPSQLTRFYLVISIGGMLGSAFNSLLAPVVFSGPFEYPLVLAGVAIYFTVLLAERASKLITVLRMAARVALFTLLLCSLLIVGVVVQQRSSIYRTRSFYSSYEVVTADHFKGLNVGTTTHGIQRTQGNVDEPLTYYGTVGPLGNAVTEFRKVHATGNWCVIGLGTGSIASYGLPGENMEFIELDARVRDIANTRFSYLRDSRANVTVKVGDGRLALKTEPSHSFDVVVVDAFSSDAVPMHMLTKEAMAIYFDKLAPGGLLLMHVTNRYLDLAPVVIGTARTQLGVNARVSSFKPTQDQIDQGLRRTTWISLSKNSEYVSAIDSPNSRWYGLRADGSSDHKWSDDYSNIFNSLVVFPKN